MAAEIYKELTTKETEEITVGVFTVDCAVQHIKAFAWQANNNIPADFAEPCVNCPHIMKCRCDWNSNLEPLFRRSGIIFRPVNRIEYKDTMKEVQPSEKR